MPMSVWYGGFTLVFKHRFLIRSMARREIAAKYRGSVLGNFWPFLAPLMLLALYTFVFGGIFKMRWPGSQSDDLGSFAMILFSGLLLNGLLADVLSRAPELVLQNVNFVKKVVFPLETLHWVTLSTAMFHFLTGFALLIVINGVIGTGLHWSLLALPLLVLPFALLLLGLTWMLSAIGVYLRDLGQLMPPLLTCVMFLSPIFYSRQQTPGALQDLMILNPLTFVVEKARAATFDGVWPPWQGWLNYCAAALFVFLLGFFVFNKLKKGFADVL